jgi:hypothetical protein
MAIGNSRDLTSDVWLHVVSTQPNECIDRRVRTPEDDAEGSNPHRQPAYQTQYFHAGSVKRHPSSRRGLLQQGTRLRLGLSPTISHDIECVTVRPHRLARQSHDPILHRLSPTRNWSSWGDLIPCFLCLRYCDQDTPKDGQNRSHATNHIDAIECRPRQSRRFRARPFRVKHFRAYPLCQWQ